QKRSGLPRTTLWAYSPSLTFHLRVWGRSLTRSAASLSERIGETSAGTAKDLRMSSKVRGMKTESSGLGTFDLLRTRTLFGSQSELSDMECLTAESYGIERNLSARLNRDLAAQVCDRFPRLRSTSG